MCTLKTLRLIVELFPLVQLYAGELRKRYVILLINFHVGCNKLDCVSPKHFHEFMKSAQPMRLSIMATLTSVQHGAHGLRPPGGCPCRQPAGASLAEFLRRLLRRDSVAARLGSLRASGSWNPQRRLSAGIPRPDRSASSLSVLFTGWGSEACSSPLLPCSSVTSRSGVSQ